MATHCPICQRRMTLRTAPPEPREAKPLVRGLRVNGYALQMINRPPLPKFDDYYGGRDRSIAQPVSTGGSH